MTQTMVIVNPASAGGRTGRTWPQTEAALRQTGIQFDVRRTTARGEATTITREALAAGIGRIVACGGDGTLNEVVNGFLTDDGESAAPDAVLGLLPSGTGGDFRKAAAIPADPTGAAAVLARGETRRIDAGMIEYADGSRHHFVNIADCGIGGVVVRRINAMRRKPRGKLLYLLTTIRTVPTYPPVHTRVEVDGIAIEGAMISIVVANGRYFGGGMHIAPHADLADGALDVILGVTGRTRSITGSRHLYRGDHIGRLGALALRGREIRITPLQATPMPFDVDGEHLGAAPVTIRTLASALNFCGPTPRIPPRETKR